MRALLFAVSLIISASASAWGQGPNGSFYGPSPTPGCPLTGCTYTGIVAHGTNAVTGSNFGITGGSIDGTCIGCTTPAVINATAFSASSLFKFTFNTNGSQPASLSGGGGAATWNYAGGPAEVDFWDLYNNASSSFNFYQKTGSSTATLVGSFNISGLTVGGTGNINSSIGTLTTGSLFQITPATRTFVTTSSPAFAVNQTLAGTITSGSLAAANSIGIIADTVSAKSGPGEIYYLYVGSNFGGGTFNGGRVGITSFMTQTGPSSSAPGTSTYIVSGLFSSQTSINEGGTSGIPSGNLFGLNNQVLLNAGATYWNSVVGQELDMLVAAGASVTYKTGLQIVLTQADATSGLLQDAAIVFTAQQNSATNGWGNVIQIGGPQGVWPANPTTGVLIGTANTNLGGRSYAAAIGIDFSAVTFSTGFLKSIGFLVDGSGNVTSPSIGNGASAFKISGSGQWSANGSVATTLTALGPTGAHVTVQEWLTVQDVGGTIRYIPAY